tara:strand:- start:6079 stop:6669 length:591 start_codon:yes stop_codon:yes gene_type:complete
MVRYFMYEHKNGLRLASLEEKDLQMMKELKDESWFGTHHITINNLNQQKKWFETMNNKDSMFFIVYQDQVPVGTYKISDIDWVSRSYQSAHDVFKEHRGKGLSKPVLEAGVDFGFEVLNMHRLDTEVLENNLASLKTALWVGFKEEGIRRKAVYKCSTYLDSICLGLIREEWMNLDRLKNYKNICNKSYTPKNNVR